MLISPAEQHPKIKELGKSSPVPEQHGADILIASKMGLIGVQRKEIKDLVQSVQDGRLHKELSQLKTCDVAVLVVEGRQMWSADGLMLNLPRKRWTKSQQIGVELSAQLRGVWLNYTTSIQDTITFLCILQEWANRSHQDIPSRSGPSSKWGTTNNKDWLCYLVQGIDGVGPKLAKQIVDKFGCPFRWKDEVTAVSLMAIDGIGVGRAEKILGALDD